MPDDNKNQPPAQTPAEAAAKNPAASAGRMASDDDLVEVKVYGKTQVVPLRLVKQDYQTSSAGRAAIEEAKRIRADAHIDREHAERWRNLETNLRKDPDGTLRNLEQLAGVHRQAQTSDDGEGSPHSDPNTRVLRERLDRLEQAHNQDRLRMTNSQALDQFTLFTKDGKAREFAEKQILAMQVLDPNIDALEAARDIHTDILAVRGANLTQQRDDRLNREQTMPNVPANAGMPDLSDIPQGASGDVRTGKFRENLERAMGRFRQTMTGQ